MTAFARLRLQAFKEARELLFPWLACLAVIAVPSVFDTWRGIEFFAYFVGTAGLGALSIGHEYTYRTMPVLLAQPVRRERLLLTKLIVLAAMLGVLYGATGAYPEVRGGPQDFEPLIPLAVMTGLFLAPWLTMLCRSPIAGAVFTGCMPGVWLTAGGLLRDVGGVPIHPMWFGVGATLALSAVAAVHIWGVFARLEAVEGGHAHVGLPAWMQRRRATDHAERVAPRRPLRLMAVKEFHLQQPAFAIATLYVIAWGGALWWSPRAKELLGVFYLLSIVYAILMALLSGALAVAEERQAGTLEWQLLMPIAASTQGIMKMAVAVGITLVLGAGLPAIAQYMAPAPTTVGASIAIFLTHWSGILTLVIVCIGSFYVSSLSSSGLRALLVALPGLLAAALIIVYGFDWLTSPVFARLRVSAESALVRWPRYLRIDLALTVGVVCAASLVLLRYALANHRSADRDVARVVKQLAGVSALLVVGAVAASFAAYMLS